MQKTSTLCLTMAIAVLLPVALACSTGSMPLRDAADDTAINQHGISFEYAWNFGDGDNKSAVVIRLADGSYAMYDNKADYSHYDDCIHNMLDNRDDMASTSAPLIAERSDAGTLYTSTGHRLPDGTLTFRR